MIFWLVNGVLIFAVLFFLLKPLLVKRSNAAQGSSRVPITAVIVVVAAVVAGAATYLNSSGYLVLLAREQADEAIAEFEAATEALRRRVAEKPHDGEARRLLAYSHYLVGDYTTAAQEYRAAAQLGALEGAGEWIYYADALLRSGNMAQTGDVLRALDEIAPSDADYDQALLLSGLLYRERGEYARVIERLQRLLELTPAEDTMIRANLKQWIAQAQEEVRNQTGKPAAPAQEKTKAAGNAIMVTVSLAEALRSSVEAGDTVFVYARAVNGPPIPLAVERLTVADLPAEVRLDEDSAVAGMSGASLVAVGQVEVVARVSKSGGALTSPGDLIGAAAPIAVGSAVTIEISKVVE